METFAVINIVRSLRMDINRIMKRYINKTKEFFIGLGFVLNDETVRVNSHDCYSYNKEVALFIVVFYYSSLYFLSIHMMAIEQSIESFFRYLLI